MPALTMVCPKCGHKKRLLRPAGVTNVTYACVCGQTMVREFGAQASARIVEVLDNGLMTRRVERLADAERLFKERAEADKKR